MRGRSVTVVWQIAFTFIGTVIGAGFASGQEIVRFFVVFGKKGLEGTVVAGLLFVVLGLMIVSSVGKENIVNYRQYIYYLFNGRIVKILDVVLIGFLICGLAVMLVASGSLFSSIWGVPSWVGFLITGFFVYTTLLLGEEGILWLNTALVPGIILLVLIVAGYAIIGCEGCGELSRIEIVQKDVFLNNWLISSFLYVAYNIVLSMVVLTSLGKRQSTVNFLGIIIGGAFLGFMAAIICLALLLHGSKVISEEIPMIFLAYKINPTVYWIYSFVLWTAILTSAVGNGFGLLKRIQARFTWPKSFIAFIILIPCVPFVGWPLSSAVRTIYPFLGYSGLLFVLAIIYKAITTSISERIRS